MLEYRRQRKTVWVPKCMVTTKVTCIKYFLGLRADLNREAEYTLEYNNPSVTISTLKK